MRGGARVEILPPMAIDARPPIYEGDDYTRLGPDPEPLGERFEVLLSREQAKPTDAARQTRAMRTAGAVRSG